ncbi:MAG: AMMECR1 domain-containing protein [Treponema sp.]|nr:AMMECR1 domain-containing protein [Treponema sp.]
MACSLFFSCSRREVHVHDRHGLSFPLVESYAKNHRGTTLVLLDYHHDVGPLGGRALGSNWVGALIAEGAVDRVLWVSGRNLLLPNKNARIAWLRRKLSSFPPDEATRIESRISLIDWQELESRRLNGPVVVSLDFDLFCHDPGNPPGRFVDKIAAWAAGQRPGLLTLALSAAYETDADSAWRRLGRFIDDYGKAGGAKAAWFLEAGVRKTSAEGEEEQRAWRRWDAYRDSFGRRDESFFPGAAIWIAPPMEIRKRLLALSARPGDAAAADILSGWRDADLAELEGSFPQARTDAILASAAASLEGYWRGDPMPPPATGHEDAGLALRIQNDGGDRGCLAICRGVSDPDSAAVYCARGAARDPRYPPVLAAERNSLDLELSVFGPWRAMKGPYDFRPGLDSLLLLRGSEITLLQASVAAERGYGRRDFLARLASKARLGTEGWKTPGLRFLRSATLWSRRPLASIEASPGYQKYEKK